MDDLAHQGLVVDDFDSPYISPSSWQNYNDDNNMIAPRFVDTGFVDDSHFAWIEIVGYRSYYVGTLIENFANVTTVTDSFDYEKSITVTIGSTITNTVTVQVGVEMGAELDGIGAKLQSLTGGSLAISNQLQTTTSEVLKTHVTVPDCSTVGLYKMIRVVELQVDYAFMEDTVLGVMYGYERETGRSIIRSLTDAGHRTEIAQGTYAPLDPVVAPPVDPPLGDLMGA